MSAPINQTKFNGGVNEEDFLAALAANEMSKAINAIITKSGSLSKREGSSEFGSDSNTPPVFALKGFTDDVGNYWKLKMSSTILKEYHAGAWDTSVKTGLTADLYLQLSDFFAASATPTVTSTATAGGDYTLTDSGASWTLNQFRDYIVKITSGTGIGQAKVILENTATQLTVDGRWDVDPDSSSGYTISPKIKALIGNNGTDTTFKIYHDGAGSLTTAALSTSYPKFTVQLVINNRLWGISGTKVYWSDLSNGEFIPAQNYIDTGETLTSLGQSGDFPAVYSKTKTGVVIGTGPDTFAFIWRDRAHGCLAPHSVASWYGYSFVLAQDGVYMFDGSTNRLCSRKIRPSILAIKDADRANSTGFVFENKYYLMHSTDSSSTAKDRIWVMDLLWSNPALADVGVWTVFEGLSPNVMGTFQDSNALLNLYIGESDTSKVVQLYDGTYADQGASTVFQVETREFDLNELGRNKKLRWFYYEGATQTVASTLQASRNIDGRGFEMIGNIDHAQTGGLWDAGFWDIASWGSAERIIKRLRPGGRGRTIQYQFYNNTASEPIEMFKYEQDLVVHTPH